MPFSDDVAALQKYAGVRVDRDFGPVTARALVVKLGLDVAPPPASGLRVAIDAGHGQDNRTAGVYDSGCVHGSLEEADVALTWAKELVQAFRTLGISNFETRPDRSSSAPVGHRAAMANRAGCTHFLSLHVNDADNPAAHGTETLYRDDTAFAQKIHSAVMTGLQLTDRGIKQRMDLAVLNFSGQACLIELGFIKSPADVARFTDPAVIKKTCALIAGSFRS